MRAVALIAALAALSLTRAPVANAQTMNPRPIDNVGNNPTDVNAGTPNQPFLRLDVPTAYFADDSGTLFPGSTIITNTTTTNTTVYPAFQCLVAPPAPPTQPYPRCVSDLVNGYTATPLGQVTDVGTRSVRRVSHFETAWAQFLEYDIVGPDGQAELINIGIPTDDVAINTGPDGVSAAVLVTSNKSIEFYRRPSSIDPDTKKSDHVGLNFVTGFLDASPVYGSSAETLQTLRDGPGTHGKMKLVAQTNSTGELGPLPPLGQDGRFILGKSPLRSSNVYTASLTIIMLREHNRQCDRLYQLHGTSWTDDQYFNEARKWVIAFVQKVTSTEYLGILLGRPLPPYTGYRQDVKPGIDTFFATASFRYAHSAVSDPISSQSPTSVNVGNGPSNSLVDLKAYPYFYEFSSQYMIQWNTDLVNNRIDIALTLQSSQGWFGIGLNSLGALSMAGADFIVAYASPSDGVKLGLFRSQGNAQAPTSDADAYPLSNVNATIVGGTAVLVTFTRAMDTGVPGKAVFTNSRMNVIWAYNPQESNPTYHGGNRGGLQINFLSGVRANGTDITNDLLGLRGDTDGVPKRKLLRQNSVPVQRDRNEKDEFVFASELQQYLAPMDKARLKKSSTQVSGVNSKRANEGFFARLLPGGSVASTIDYVNSSFFQPGEIARHTHSDYAKRKLATMVTARIDNSDDGSAAVLQIPDALAHRKGRESPTGMFISPRPASGLVRTKATVPLTLRPPVTRLQTQFRRFVLIDKTNIAHGEHPVVAFTFAPVHALGEQYSVPTLPGQYVELMSQIRQETVKRPYNVVHGSVNTEFTIYVKIYANGKMSRHLDQDRQVKSEISVRGPFDITRRTPVEDLIWKRPADIDPNVVPRTDSIMLNPERADGRWRHAYAIVGGTGITPILQLIEHYQYIYKKEREQKSKLANSSTPPASDSPNDPPLLTWIHILIANRAVLDVIESAELETVAKHTGNRYLRVTISYVFSEPPEKWQGMKGLLNREKVEEWVRSCQEQAMSSTHNDRDSSTAAGVSGGPSEKSRDSVRKSHTIQDVMPGLGRASQVPAVSVTYAEEEEEEEEVRYKPGEDGSVASITLSRSSTAVGIETISGSLMGPDRQNVVLICGPDRMMENVKSILMEIDVEEIRERSWVITLY
ncbi:hypothetical protein BC938DRAFT_479064 [Jimgerdemannia flammicorona]|uniref:FAD-binding FR-type domain-containing protein n=1 Tax=Jimgerdemannia flammicorona TaxID=994334 RepID=A0A433QLQ5_9FUNG|nr:hypothetical protein BC938DRAFT_479064 [Jimgerdemannia flammicorona]